MLTWVIRSECAGPRNASWFVAVVLLLVWRGLSSFFRVHSVATVPRTATERDLTQQQIRNKSERNFRKKLQPPFFKNFKQKSLRDIWKDKVLKMQPILASVQTKTRLCGTLESVCFTQSPAKTCVKRSWRLNVRRSLNTDRCALRDWPIVKILSVCPLLQVAQVAIQYLALIATDKRLEKWKLRPGGRKAMNFQQISGVLWQVWWLGCSCALGGRWFDCLSDTSCCCCAVWQHWTFAHLTDAWPLAEQCLIHIKPLNNCVRCNSVSQSRETVRRSVGLA